MAATLKSDCLRGFRRTTMIPESQTIGNNIKERKIFTGFDSLIVLQGTIMVDGNEI